MTPHDSAVVFVVSDVAASLAHYEEALGFEEAFRYGEPLFYGGVCRGSVTIHLQDTKETERPVGHGLLYVFVDDADAAHRELQERGARILKAPETYPYGMRDFNVADPDGNELVFGSEADPDNPR